LATVSFRTESGVADDEVWTLVDSAVLSKTVPWRKFRWYKGQRHYSGAYWSATMRDHVVYESRLELARLIFADFDRFAAAIGYQTLSGAAEHLGVAQSTLVIQINRLERDIGGSLLERAERGRPMTPTGLGEQVLAAFHRTSQPAG
jgi:Bacterial regulatory helix-turn-helix protein, lysR family